MDDAQALARALVILQRRPRLAMVVLAVSEMIDRKRQCGVNIDIRDGIIRVLQETPWQAIPYDDSGAAPTG